MTPEREGEGHKMPTHACGCAGMRVPELRMCGGPGGGVLPTQVFVYWTPRHSVTAVSSCPTLLIGWRI